ncbi:ATP-grasp domain-containing protein [Staphylococcus pseudintermedius]|uniref:ATP-grasp domain-containing protein n=2 Tax=Staphylococcus pseudintermedius TaxID=283734 RepID=UPI00256A418B|nr:ATP-grasp domain-containing protein [Staphylococcus pseudintermedius]ELN1780451.1 ATP-grasp domain-containing protein [Staphylococcus pseudintermedius]MDK3696066.1 ATP-grasp domain-containing protein [Staphylococcus pseudintermedius]MDT0840047.1 ATP-grasp domain-containing protein [Staphylococcus pseudintermedius]MDT1047622.1 ATP-grasp domain-containing protein [Staphylococcus pseudintermedius]HAR6490928.1 ATP-grasp domain-containing protein [Staphylococcus pseudintermedius]
MSIVIIDREGKSKRDYLEWLNGLDQEVYILGYLETIESFSYDKAVGFPEFETNGNVEQFIYELNQIDPVTNVLAFEEGSVIRAACIRKNLGIRGQTLEGALLFRDKYLMREKLFKKGLKMPEFRKVNHFMDIVSFCELFGYPVILKPRKKWASKGVIKIENKGSLLDILSNVSLDDYMVEEYVSGQLYHVDGFFNGQSIEFSCCSMYIKNCLEAFEEGFGLGSIMLDIDSNEDKLLKKYTAEILKTFEVDYNTIFHAEIFIDSSGNPILCEIGSRLVGGGYTKNIIKSFSINLDEYLVKRELGIPYDIGNISNVRLSGKVWIPAQNGYVKSIPTLDLEGLIDIRTKQYKNVRFTGLEKQMDYLLTVSFFGNDMKELLHKAIYIKNFYIKSIDWSETIIDTWFTT